jgi:hypothetical protein
VPVHERALEPRAVAPLPSAGAPSARRVARARELELDLQGEDDRGVERLVLTRLAVVDRELRARLRIVDLDGRERLVDDDRSTGAREISSRESHHSPARTDDEDRDEREEECAGAWSRGRMHDTCVSDGQDSPDHKRDLPSDFRSL